MAAPCGGWPPDSENIVVRAVRLLRSRSGHALDTSRSGACLNLVKRIPVAAGLGGGSSDAAAALVAANWGWGLGWSNEQLAVLVQELGSDVAFFLRGRQVHIETRGTDTPGTEMPTTGPAICRGRGERVEPLVPRSVLHCVLVKPPEGLSTAQVYANCRPAVATHPLAALVDALRRRQTAMRGSFCTTVCSPRPRCARPGSSACGRSFAVECSGAPNERQWNQLLWHLSARPARPSTRGPFAAARGIGWAFAVAASC